MQRFGWGTILFAAFMVCCTLFSVPFAAGTEIKAPAAPVRATLFGMHIHRAGGVTTWPAAPIAAWRLWDTYAVWPWLEPRKGGWQFGSLDKLVSLAEKHRVELLLPLAFSPEWASARPKEKSAYGMGMAAEPANIEDWRNYVATVGKRYKGRIRYYENWNEPNLRNFYSGNMETILALSRDTYRILKGIDPGNVIVSPSPSGGYKESAYSWLDEYFSKGGGDFADVIGYHFYVTPGRPERMADEIAKVKTIMARHGLQNKPLWNTESGWFIDNRQARVNPTPTGTKSRVLSEEEAAAYVARAYIMNWASGVERYYYYAWDNKEMGLVEPDGKTPKYPAQAYAETHKWLVGARMTRCVSDADETWICDLERDGGYRGWILWNPDRYRSHALPEEWQVKQGRDLKGQKRSLDGAASVEIGPVPILVENHTE
jgi:hypothetical protein